MLCCETHSQFLPLGLHRLYVAADEAREFAWMRRDNEGSFAPLETACVLPHGVQAVGIQHQRQGHLSEQGCNERGDPRSTPQARTDGEDVLTFRQFEKCRRGFGREQALLVLRQSRREVTRIGPADDRLDRFRDRDIDQSGSAT